MTIVGALCALIRNLSVPEKQKLDLGFLADDVRNQLVHSRDILTEAEKLQSLLAEESSPTVKKVLQETIEKLINVATQLSSNASSTASSTGTIVGRSFSESWDKYK